MEKGRGPSFQTSRAKRRRMKRMAPTIARKLAPTVILRGDGGALAKIDDAGALAILEAVIAESLTIGGSPVFRCLTSAEATGFPFVQSIERGSAWLAVALGLDGRVAVVVRRLEHHSARLALLALPVGLGMSLVGLWLDGVATALFGYSVPYPPSFFPTTLAQAAVALAALVVAAPLCEEVLFRGVLQRAYERLGPAAGIILGGLVFAFFHMRLQGVLPILPVSLALGYVVWRSGSLLPGVLTHFAYNLVAGGLLILSSLRPEVNLAPLVSAPAALVGLAVTLAALWGFHRAPTPPTPPERLVPPMTTAAMASSSYAMPAFGWPAVMRAASTTPARPAIAPHAV